MAIYGGVKFFSTVDLSSGYYLKRAEPIIDSFSTDKIYDNVNEVIELYNIKQFFDHDIRLMEWDQNIYDVFCQKVSGFMPSIGKFFSKLNCDNFEQTLSEVDIFYKNDFLHLVELFNVHKRLSSKLIQQLLKDRKIFLYDILQHKNLSSYFQDEIRECMLEDSDAAEILLSFYLEKDATELYIPNCLLAKDRETILNTYIDSNDSNPNYLQLLINSNPTKELPFSDKTKLKAKRAYEKYTKELFNENTGFCYEVCVSFSGSQHEEVKQQLNGQALECSYGTNWIKNNLDFPTLLNNFIYIFGFTDFQFRSQWYYRKAQQGILEREIGVHGKTEYRTGFYFETMSMLSIAQIMGYSKELLKYNIELEKVIQWFFEEYLKSEFDIVGYRFSAPSNQVSYAEKCKLLVIELERILKQFKLYIENGIIDKDLLEISSKQIKFEYIPSMIKNKYLYPVKGMCNPIMDLLFSDQSDILYTEKFNLKYKTFYELAIKETVYKEDFEEYQIRSINYLIDRKILKSNSNGQLILNQKKALLLKDLYNHEVCRTDYVTQFLNAFEPQEIETMFTYGSTLFSKPEQAYLNYMLNNSEFSNGLALRNNYLHGTNSTDEYANQQDYYQILKLLIFTIIKINEEFCFGQQETIPKAIK